MFSGWCSPDSALVVLPFLFVADVATPSPFNDYATLRLSAATTRVAVVPPNGSAEIAGVENAARSKTQGWKLHEWKREKKYMKKTRQSIISHIR